MFDTRSGEPVGSPIPRAANARFSPDGTLLAVAGFDGPCGSTTGSTLGRSGPSWNGSRAFAQSLEFSGDGRVLATVALDSSARLFDVDARAGDGRAVPGARGHPGRVASRRQGAGRWRFPARATARGPRCGISIPRHWRTAACLEAGRNLTQAEWDLYIGGDYRETCPQWPAAA